MSESELKPWLEEKLKDVSDRAGLIGVMKQQQQREAELEREVERLKHQLHIATRHRDTYKEIVKHLKKQFEEAKAINAEFKKQNDQLKQDDNDLAEEHANNAYDWMVQCERAEAENKKLREALITIQGLPFRSDVHPDCQQPLIEILIKKALEGGNE